ILFWIWKLKIPEARVFHLPKTHSDHCPLLINMKRSSGIISHNRRFRYKVAWLSAIRLHGSFSPYSPITFVWGGNLTVVQWLMQLEIQLRLRLFERKYFPEKNIFTRKYFFKKKNFCVWYII
ncbi:hypothetical protein CFOL_v3_34491, partial [Cephalotus follicularis]